MARAALRDRGVWIYCILRIPPLKFPYLAPLLPPFLAQSRPRSLPPSRRPCLVPSIPRSFPSSTLPPSTLPSSTDALCLHSIIASSLPPLAPSLPPLHPSLPSPSLPPSPPSLHPSLPPLLKKVTHIVLFRSSAECSRGWSNSHEELSEWNAGVQVWNQRQVGDWLEREEYAGRQHPPVSLRQLAYLLSLLASRTNNLSFVACTASLRDSWVSLVI